MSHVIFSDSKDWLVKFVTIKHTAWKWVMSLDHPDGSAKP